MLQVLHYRLLPDSLLYFSLSFDIERVSLETFDFPLLRVIRFVLSPTRLSEELCETRGVALGCSR